MQRWICKFLSLMKLPALCQCHVSRDVHQCPFIFTPVVTFGAPLCLRSVSVCISTLNSWSSTTCRGAFQQHKNPPPVPCPPAPAVIWYPAANIGLSVAFGCQLSPDSHPEYSAEAEGERWLSRTTQLETVSDITAGSVQQVCGRFEYGANTAINRSVKLYSQDKVK